MAFLEDSLPCLLLRNNSNKHATREPSQVVWLKMEGEHALLRLARKIAVYFRQCLIGHIHSTHAKLGNGGVDRVRFIVGVMVYIAQYLGVGQGKEPHIKEVICWMHTEGPSQAYAEN